MKKGFDSSKDNESILIESQWNLNHVRRRSKI